METPEQSPSPPETSDQHSRTPHADRSGTAVLIIIGVFAAGWFALSHFIMATPVSDAIGEALGATLGLLVLISIIGAIRMRDR